MGRTISAEEHNRRYERGESWEEHEATVYISSLYGFEATAIDIVIDIDDAEHIYEPVYSTKNYNYVRFNVLPRHAESVYRYEIVDGHLLYLGVTTMEG